MMNVSFRPARWKTRHEAPGVAGGILLPPAEIHFHPIAFTGNRGGNLKSVHILNLGAGVQSTKLALEFDAGEVLDKSGAPIQLDAGFFGDTQDEPVAVYKHLKWICGSVKNYPIHIRTKGRLSEHLMRGQNSTGQRFASIPAFTKDGNTNNSPGMVRRQCSAEYKIDVINKAIRQEILGLEPRKTIPKGVQVTQYLGISADETGRAVRVMRNAVPESLKIKSRRWNYFDLQEFFSTRRWRFGFPLVDRGQTRADCIEYLEPRVPHETPRSACVQCPYHDDAEWERIKLIPEDWDLAVAVDRSLRIVGNVFNRNLDQQLFLHRSCVPLEFVILNPTPDPRKAQLSMNFSYECLGVCGV